DWSSDVCSSDLTDFFFALPPGSHQQLSCRLVCGSDGVNSVHHQIQHDLLQLHTVSHQVGQIAGQIQTDRYMLLLCFRPNKRHQLLNDIVAVEPILDGSFFLKQSANAAQDCSCASSILNDF